MTHYTATSASGATFTRNSEHTYTHAVLAAPAPGNKGGHYDAAQHGVAKFASFHGSLKAAQAKVRQITKVYDPRFIVGGAYEIIEIEIVTVEAR